MDKQIELEAAEALLDIGVSVPLKAIRIPFIHKRIALRLTMRRPVLGNQIRIARLYLGMGVTYGQMLEFTKEEEMEFMAIHGKTVSRMVALTICRGSLAGTLFARPLAWFLRWFVPDIFLQGANLHFVSLMGTRSFIDIIRSAGIANPMKPKLSQQVKGS